METEMHTTPTTRFASIKAHQVGSVNISTLTKKPCSKNRKSTFQSKISSALKIIFC